MMTAPAIPRIEYSPPQRYPHGLEVLSFAELRQRAPLALLQRTERLGFGLVLGVVRGACVHHVDVVPHALQAGDWLVLNEGQVQAWDLSSDWDGVLLVYQPGVLQASDVAAFQPWLQLMGWQQPVLHATPEEHRACLQAVAQIRLDAEREAGELSSSVSTLSSAAPLGLPGLDRALAQQLGVLLWRLTLPFQRQQAGRLPTATVQRERFVRFIGLMAQRVAKRYRVSDYLRELACTEKTLNRACQQFAGCSAKALVTQQLLLQAKRLLVHTQDPVHRIAEQLWFDQPTQFSQFFQREASMSPRAFRQLHQRSP
jgi:AraC-like DNA-binding protein